MKSAFKNKKSQIGPTEIIVGILFLASGAIILLLEKYNFGLFLAAFAFLIEALKQIFEKGL